MRTERNRDGTFNVWMSRDEYRELPRQAHSGLAEVALRLMGDCGLRVAEVPDVTAEDSLCSSSWTRLSGVENGTAEDSRSHSRIPSQPSAMIRRGRPVG